MGKFEGPGQFTPEESPIQPLSIFQQRLPTDDGQLHVLVPGGSGDQFWIIYKWWAVAMERDVTFWLPYQEQRRGGDVYQMCGLQYGYLPDLTTQWVWSRPGSPAIPDTGAVLSIQPNRHLEHGHRLEKWYPDLEGRNPCQFMENTERLYKQEAGARKHVVGFMSSTNYMEYGGNLKPAQWARIFQMVERDIGPVVIVAAGADTDFLGEVMKFFEPSLEPIVNAPLSSLARAMAGAELVIGAHSGPLIMSIYMGVPTFQAMPRWLSPMVGTWEPIGGKWAACFLDDLENRVREGDHIKLLNGDTTMQGLQAFTTVSAARPETKNQWFHASSGEVGNSGVV